MTGVVLLDLLILWRVMRFGFWRLRRGMLIGRMGLFLFLLPLLFLRTSSDGHSDLDQGMKLPFPRQLMVLRLLLYPIDVDI